MSWIIAGWWILYTALAIALQSLVPGLDFLLPGLLLALQQRQFMRSLCLAAVFLVLQEGMGSMSFGSTFLLYILTFLSFYAACSLFEGKSALFVVLLGAALAAAHYFTFALAASLQDIPWQPAALRTECVMQAFFTPLIWWAASTLYRIAIHESRA